MTPSLSVKLQQPVSSLHDTLLPAGFHPRKHLCVHLCAHVCVCVFGNVLKKNWRQLYWHYSVILTLSWGFKAGIFYLQNPHFKQWVLAKSICKVYKSELFLFKATQTRGCVVWVGKSCCEGGKSCRPDIFGHLFFCPAETHWICMRCWEGALQMDSCMTHVLWHI